MIQSLLSGSVSTWSRFLIVLIPAPGRVCNFPQSARRSQDSIAHFPWSSSSLISKHIALLKLDSWNQETRLILFLFLGVLSCCSRVIEPNRFLSL